MRTKILFSSNIAKLFIYILLILSPFSCKKENNSKIPYADVNFTINLNDTRFLDLNNVGGWVYVTAKEPSKGIILYRKNFDEFLAYERTCTYDPTGDCCRLTVEESSTWAVDSCCGSQFLLLDGSAHSDGPATQPMKRYNTVVEGNNLHVYN